MALFLMYHTFAFAALFSYGLYHLTLATLSHFKNFPNSISPQPYHPLPLSPHRHPLLRHLPLLLLLLSFLLSLIYNLSLSLSSVSPLSLSYLHLSLCLLLFSLLSLSSPLIPLPSDLSFLLAALIFSLLSFSPSPSLSPSDLQAFAHSISSTISLSSALFAFSLALFPRHFLLEICLAASVALQGLWSLQTGLSLYADPFIPDGCHRLLDVSGAATRCDLDESRVRAAKILDLLFALHLSIVAVAVVAVYVVVGRDSGGGEMKGLAGGRRYNGGGAYESLSTASSGGVLSDMDQVQMKAMGKSSAQA